MKGLITLFFLFLITSILSAQPPIVETTAEKSSMDFTKGITNEKWYKRDNMYQSIFKLTPIGIKHAYEKYYQLRKKYKTDDCIINDLISDLAKKGGEIDYEMLAATIKLESSEIDTRCWIEDNAIDVMGLSSVGGMDGFITLMLRLKKK